MNKKICIVTFIFLLISSCMACSEKSLNIEVESTYENMELNVSDDDSAFENNTVVKVIDTVEFFAAINQSVENVAPNVNIDDCDTFTKIIDKKLEDGMGWTNEDFGDTSVLMVCSGTYDNLDGNMASIDATIYIYKDAVPTELGKVCSGGTAYPLAKNDVYLYTASNHWICKNIVTEDGIQIIEGVMVEYDSTGKETYYYASQEGGDSSEIGQTEIEEIFNNLYEEMGNAKVLSFDIIQR